ncbi:DUF3857 domain-containing protein [Sphingomonas sp. MMS24-J13]|uniref:DUF3857 domain-containing protein n=1 Tax=Sphingomonas sp. MMS24-J13 TaxID=3238686 RepID=UPI00384CE538
MRGIGFTLLLAVPSAAHAADFTVGPPAAWVQAVEPPPATHDDGAIDARLADLQIHFDAAGMHQYIHQVMRVLQPQALQAVGSFGAVWQPGTDKITFHRVVIHRGDQDIDVLKDGSGLQVIRREAGLESAMIDGKLTATMPVPDLRVGDEVEFAYTIDSFNPVLGSHRESDQFFARSVPIDRLYIRNSWPAGGSVRWRAGAGLPKPVLSKSAHAETVLTIDQAAFLAPAVPAQSPGRFIDANRLQTSDFGDWQSLSAMFAPLFDGAARPAPDSPLKAEIAKIAAASSDPKAQALAALQLVQSQVRYLARVDGLGGYKPASADAVWKERLGDCKGKTVLLLTLLRGLGVDAQAAVVSVQQSDGVDASLPLAGRFDHVIVRATIDGKVYWLDGTRLGDRDLDQIAVPGFQWALPLTQPGSGLVRLIATEPALPTEEWTLDLDARDGVSLPAKATGIGILRGDGASAFRTSMTFLSQPQREELLRKVWAQRHDWVEIKDVTYTVDEKNGEVRIGFAGTGKMDWNLTGSDASYRYQANKAFLGQVVTPNRDSSDPDVPVKVDERYSVTHQTILLPNAGKGFYVDGEAIDRTEAGIHYVRTASVHDGKFEMTASTRSKAGEVTLAAAKAADKKATELFNKNLYVHLPASYLATSRETVERGAVPSGDSDAVQLVAIGELARKHDYAAALKEVDAGLKNNPKNIMLLLMKAGIFIAQRKLDEADASLDAALAADRTNIAALDTKAGLLIMRGRYEDSLILYDRSILIQPDNGMTYYARGNARMMLGRNEAALADMLLAVDKRPDFPDARVAVVSMLWRLDRLPEALAQAEAFVKAMPGNDHAHALYGEMLFFSGKKEQALTEMRQSIAIRPNANAYLALLDHNFATDEKTALAYAMGVIADQPQRVIPAAVLSKFASDQTAYANLMTAYDKAQKDHPDDAMIRAARRAIDEAFGHMDKVLIDLDKEIAANPKNAGLLNQSCWARATHHIELDKALARCDEGIALQKGPGILDSRGLVHLQRGEMSAAVVDYDAALAAMPQLPTSLYGRGLAKIRLGSAKDGNADLAAARKINSKIDAEFAGYGLKP